MSARLADLSGVADTVPSMTELLAALLGAIVGGALSAWVGSRQTVKVLKHETAMATAERLETQRADDARRVTLAADQLITGLAEFTAASRNHGDWTPNFVRIMATDAVHRAREGRASALLQTGLSYAHVLPVEVQARWETLVWLVRFCNSKIEDRSEELRRRDASDLLNYCEYIRRSLLVLGGDYPAQVDYAAPNVRREDRRPWGFKPAEGSDEPDLTDWHLDSRLVGEVRFSDGEVRWYGPNGQVEELPPDEPSQETPEEA